ncbi:MAG: enoyl-[acyl-carrier-protein] reductase FabL [Chloroflexi bacterium]|nr:enoyl-[acyl-carrier-protein] reductase FabL [Chloroflexota bacterium]|tara:strand:+ start:1988 stop:2812 length:825 start_codon:yes stop_codon:yes gene_type:complete
MLKYQIEVIMVENKKIYSSLNGKNALILGGSRGIGKAISIRLAQEGCNVLINYARSKDAATETATTCKSYGVEAKIVQGDIGKESSVKEIYKQINGNNLDILINNAARGLERPRPAIDQKPKHLHSTMDVNLFGPWHAIQHAFPLMKEKGGGVIINLLSPGSEHYMPNYSAVGISKAALSSLTMYMSVELAPYGIRVNGISAGWVEGSDGEHSYRKEVSERVKPFVPIGRNVSPEDIASAAAWMCSDESSMLVGHVLHIDGGFNHGAWNAILDN